MKHFLIYTNIHKDKDLALTGHIKAFLEERQCSVHVLTQETDEEGSTQEEISRQLKTKADCMLVLGGDGTILRAVRDVKELNIPILGVNLGTLGYMTEVEPEQIDEALEQLLRGDVEYERRMMLWAVAKTAEGGQQEQWALNDVVISRRGSLQMNDFNIYVNGQFLKKYSADGVIITTPTGSTGYNLSAGGPIAAPETKLLMITPICPHTFNQRSIILSPDDKIVVEIPGGREGKVQEVEASFDGNGQMHLHTGDAITITKSEKEVIFLKLNKINFLEILSRKMSEN
ncbi:MAG: NAD(+)/NADH kinase [Lachnospiraceae bacterium]|nr:NAD(+)/NADH kinase [Lachnospiraceae bacterium]